MVFFEKHTKTGSEHVKDTNIQVLTCFGSTRGTPIFEFGSLSLSLPLHTHPPHLTPPQVQHERSTAQHSAAQVQARIHTHVCSRVFSQRRQRVCMSPRASSVRSLVGGVVTRTNVAAFFSRREADPVQILFLLAEGDGLAENLAWLNPQSGA